MIESRKKPTLPEWYKGKLGKYAVKAAQWLLVEAVVIVVLMHAVNLVGRL